MTVHWTQMVQQGKTAWNKKQYVSQKKVYVCVCVRAPDLPEVSVRVLVLGGLQVLG